MQEWRRRGLKSSWIWGNKRTGLTYVRKHRDDLYARAMSIIKAKKAVDHDLIMLFLEVPGLGIPKSAFVVQLLTGKAGCMDVHNIKRYMPEVDASKGTPAMFQASGNSDTKSRKVYSLDIVDEAGGSVNMWINWCNLIGLKQDCHFTGGADVSALHQECCNNVTTGHYIRDKRIMLRALHVKVLIIRNYACTVTMLK